MSVRKLALSERDQLKSDLLCSAFEGGSNYWYMIEAYRYPKGKTARDFEFPYLEVPFAGGAIKITADGEKKVLDRESIEKGWKLMIEKYPRHYADAMTDFDAITGDVYLQLCLFGDIIFG